MKWISRRRPSPALIVASLALFVSLSGVSYGVATGFIDSREIKNNEVRSLDIRNNEIRTRDIRNNQVRGVDIRNSTVQGRDVGVNTITGVDINEGTLAKVPSAATADTATSATTAGSAGSVNTLKIIRTTVAKGPPPGTTVTLATHGPLTLLGNCEDSGGGDTLVRLLVDTSENNSAAGSGATPDPDLDAADPPLAIGSVDDPAAAPQSVAFTDVFASAPSGRAFTGQIAMYADAAASSCRFHGHLALQG